MKRLHPQSGWSLSVKCLLCRICRQQCEHLFLSGDRRRVGVVGKGIFKIGDGFCTVRFFGNEQQGVVRVGARDRLPDHHRRQQGGDTNGKDHEKERETVRSFFMPTLCFRP